MSDDDGLDGWDPTRPAFDRSEGGADLPVEEDDEARAEGAADAEGAGESAGPDAGVGAPEEAPPAGDADVSGTGDGRLLGPRLEALAELASRTAAALEDGTARYARWVEATLRDGGKLIFCGNGGSAATVEHVAAEYAVRYRRQRDPLPALALTASGPMTTAAANDFTYEEVFAHQLRALARPGDLVVVHSTSGESENVIRAVRTATEMSLRSVGLLAGDGGRVAGQVSLALVVPTDEVARAQEMHLAIEHAVADEVDRIFAEG